jgi:hypothetical protein
MYLDSEQDYHRIQLEMFITITHGVSKKRFTMVLQMLLRGVMKMFTVEDIQTTHHSRC